MSAPKLFYTAAELGTAPPGGTFYAVLGHPIGHSLSPLMQQAALDALGIPARYVGIDCAEEELPGLVERLKQLGCPGWNCTVPLKVRMAPLISQADDMLVRLSHAVNTVTWRDGLLRGYSTDGPGWEASLKENWGVDLKGLRVLILGAGGAGRVIAIHCAIQGCARLLLANRTEKIAKEVELLIRDLPNHDPHYVPAFFDTLPWNSCALAEATEQVDLIVNTTSLGLKPDDPSPVPPSVFREGLLAYDLIYKPTTPFLQAAAAAGARGANGLSMLLYQGWLAFQRWHPERTAEEFQTALAAMRGALEKATGQKL